MMKRLIEALDRAFHLIEMIGVRGRIWCEEHYPDHGPDIDELIAEIERAHARHWHEHEANAVRLPRNYR